MLMLTRYQLILGRCGGVVQWYTEISSVLEEAERLQNQLLIILYQL